MCLIIVDHIISLVCLYSSSFVIFLGHFTFNIFLSSFLWSVSIFSPVFVNVHNELLYINMEAVYALNQLCFVLERLSLICRCFILFVGMYDKFSSLYIFVLSSRLPNIFHFPVFCLLL